jgi:hypothetical protein
MQTNTLFWFFAVLGGLVWNGVIDAIVVLGGIGHSPSSPQAWLLYGVALGWWAVFVGCTALGARIDKSFSSPYSTSHFSSHPKEDRSVGTTTHDNT